MEMFCNVKIKVNTYHKTENILYTCKYKKLQICDVK